MPTFAVALTEQPPAMATISISAPASTSVEARIQPRAFLLVRPVHTQYRASTASATQRPTRKVTAIRARKATQPVTEELVVPPGGDRSIVLRFALSQVGKRYRYGGTGDGGWDCSGLVSAAYRNAGVSLPHSSGAIGREGRAVPAGQWRPGDVIASSGHVALYLGNGLMVEAANPRAGVRVTRVRPGTAHRF